VTHSMASRRSAILLAGVVSALIFSTACLRARERSPAPASLGPSPNDSAEVAAAVERYHAALASGDSAAAVSLLAPDAVILESGGFETREEYISHHLPSDIAFARAVQSERRPIRVTMHGDVAWAVSSSSTRGEFRGRQVDSVGAELMVLVRTPEGWKISAIHWSSRSRGRS